MNQTTILITAALAVAVSHVAGYDITKDYRTSGKIWLGAPIRIWDEVTTGHYKTNISASANAGIYSWSVGLGNASGSADMNTVNRSLTTKYSASLFGVNLGSGSKTMNLGTAEYHSPYLTRTIEGIATVGIPFVFTTPVRARLAGTTYFDATSSISATNSTLKIDGVAGPVIACGVAFSSVNYPVSGSFLLGKDDLLASAALTYTPSAAAGRRGLVAAKVSNIFTGPNGTLNISGYPINVRNSPQTETLWNQTRYAW